MAFWLLWAGETLEMVSSQSNEFEEESLDADKNGIAEVECRAAYVLARDCHLIDGWLFAVRRMADSEVPRWEWRFPDTLFGSSYDVPPMHLFAEIDDALRDLAVAGRANAAILVELHRCLDDAADSCAQLAEFARWDQLEEIRDDYFSFGSDLQNAMWLVQRILQGDDDSVDIWLRLGDRIGLLLTEKGLRPDAWYRSVISEIVDDAASVSSPDLGRLQKLPILKGDQRENPYREFKNIAEMIDEELVRCLGGASPSEAWIVFNDQRQVLTFLGVDIPFDDFQDQTGLNILRVLVQHPGIVLAAPDILVKADSAADAGEIKRYISRFRRVLKSIKEQWPATFQKGPLKERAEAAFIVADTKAKKRAHTKHSWYRLDLPPHRVMFVPATNPS